MKIRYDRLIIAMDDDELEQFCRQWVEGLSNYHEVRRFAGTGDKGRDVVGFVTKARHEGPWDNYQCKQYRVKLSQPEGLLAIGKILYWASRGDFTVPRRFYFVAPNGLNQKLDTLVQNPSALRQALIDNWDTACATKIVSGTTIPLDVALMLAIDAFDFTEVHKLTVDEMMADPAIKPLLFALFGADPGKYPPGVVPLDVGGDEQKYLDALVAAYGERESITFAGHDEVFAHAVHGPDLHEHRANYFEADAFQKFYRDSTSPEVISDFRKDIHAGVKYTLKVPASDTLARIEAVMSQAAIVNPAGPLKNYAYVPVKQGVCHHLVNDDEMSWK